VTGQSSSLSLPADHYSSKAPSLQWRTTSIFGVERQSDSAYVFLVCGISCHTATLSGKKSFVRFVTFCIQITQPARAHIHSTRRRLLGCTIATVNDLSQRVSTSVSHPFTHSFSVLIRNRRITHPSLIGAFNSIKQPVRLRSLRPQHLDCLRGPQPPHPSSRGRHG
jgi:hypothetical protein